MKPLLLLLAAASLPLLAGAQGTDPCQTQRNTAEIEECARLTLAAQDAALNRAYRALMRSLEGTDDASHVQARRQLAQAQRRWLQFRDADCRAKLTLHATASIRGAIYLTCLAERTQQRTRELERWRLGDRKR